MGYGEQIDFLAPLETFDERAFVGDAEFSQGFCDFVLALALVYNDFRDVVSAQRMLLTVRPVNQSDPSPELGNYGGVGAHLLRLSAGLLHELTNLINDHESLLSGQPFTRLVRTLPLNAREAWDSIVAASQSRPSSDPLAMLLVRARNKVAFHYDAEEIGRGYRAAFIDKHAKFSTPFISRGEAMADTRFYFIDAAAEVYMEDVTQGVVAAQFLDASLPLFNQVNHALREIVIRFLGLRGFGWREYRVPRDP